MSNSPYCFDSERAEIEVGHYCRICYRERQKNSFQLAVTRRTFVGNATGRNCKLSRIHGHLRRCA
jgi:hypothetical protein